MQNRILLIIVLVLSLILVSLKSSSKNTTFFNSDLDIKIKNHNTNKIEKLNLEEYIIGVVAAEMPASFNIEALKAQAVAARTYAVNKMLKNKKEYDVVTDVSNQSFITIEEMKIKWGNDFDKYYLKVTNAINETKGKVLVYKNEVIEAYYFAMSNGYTEESSLVFSEDRDYLKSVKSEYDNKTLKNFLVKKEFTKEEICEKLDVICSQLTFTEIQRSASNRVNSIKVNGIKFKGTEFRKLLGLRSTDFNIDISNEKIIITTKGYGHGVGMSQYGANGMAKAGFSYDEILKYYYKNVKITSI